MKTLHTMLAAGLVIVLAVMAGSLFGLPEHNPSKDTQAALTVGSTIPSNEEILLVSRRFRDFDRDDFKRFRDFGFRDFDRDDFRRFRDFDRDDFRRFRDFDRDDFKRFRGFGFRDFDRDDFKRDFD